MRTSSSAPQLALSNSKGFLMPRPIAYESQKSKKTLLLEDSRPEVESQILEFEILKTGYDNLKSHSRLSLIETRNGILNSSSSTSTLPFLLTRQAQNTLKKYTSSPSSQANRPKTQQPAGTKQHDSEGSLENLPTKKAVIEKCVQTFNDLKPKPTAWFENLEIDGEVFPKVEIYGSDRGVAEISFMRRLSSKYHPTADDELPLRDSDVLEVGRLVLTRDKIVTYQLLQPPDQAFEAEYDDFFSDMDNGPTAEQIRIHWENWFLAIRHLIRVEDDLRETNRIVVRLKQPFVPVSISGTFWDLAQPPSSTKFKDPQMRRTKTLPALHNPSMTAIAAPLDSRKVYLFFRDT